MTLTKLREDMNIARHGSDTVRLGVLKELIGAVEKAGIDQKKRDCPEELVDAALLKEQKMTKEMITTCPVTRPDLAAQYQIRLNIIDEYAPKLMSIDEIKQKVAEMLAINPEIRSNRGIAMKTAVQLFKGKADMKIVSQIIAEQMKK